MTPGEEVLRNRAQVKTLFTITVAFSMLLVLAAYTTVPVLSSESDAANASIDPTCNDHITRGGDHRQDCNAIVKVHSVGDAAMVEIRATDALFFDSKIWTVRSTPANNSHYIMASNDSDSKLFFKDTITVTAVYQDGRREILTNHTFTCHDTPYPSCNATAEERAS